MTDPQHNEEGRKVSQNEKGDSITWITQTTQLKS